jgi:hypothetical protein
MEKIMPKKSGVSKKNEKIKYLLFMILLKSILKRVLSVFLDNNSPTTVEKV